MDGNAGGSNGLRAIRPAREADWPRAGCESSVLDLRSNVRNPFPDQDNLMKAESGYRAVITALVLVLTVGSFPARAQTPPAANPADVASIDAIMAAVYDVISGPAGEKRDWDRFRSLFQQGARLIPSGPRQQGGFGLRVMTPDEYATNAAPGLEQNGFFEVEIARTVEEYGQIAHVFSTYESRRNASDETPFARGINSFQLFNDGSRWWVVTIYWQQESPASPIPAKYLPRGSR
jgi:hypothetical protein